MIEVSPEVVPAVRPAARETLAAAGPVEPPPSPALAPGPTFSASPRKTRADYFITRKTPALVNQARTLYRRGECDSSIARALGVTSDTVRRWLDPDYDQRRRSRAVQRLTGPEDMAEDASLLPTLPHVPGIVISGRYRMKPPR